MKKILCLLFAFFLLSSAAFAEEGKDPVMEKVANDLRELARQFNAPPVDTDIAKPIDFAASLDANARGVVLKNMKDVMNRIDPEYTADIELPAEGTSFIAQASANWMVTRALLFGFTGLGESKQIVEGWVSMDGDRITYIKEGTPPWFIARSAQIARYYADVSTLHSDHAPVDFGTEVSTGEGDMNIPSDAVDEIKGLLKATQYAAGLEGVPGIKAGDCVYDRSLLIAKILWCVIFVVNIVWVAYKTLIAGEEGDMVTTIFKSIFVFLSVHFLRSFMVIGMSVSTAVGNAMLGNTDVAHAVSDISDIVGMKQSLVSVSSGFLGNMIAQAFIHICGTVAQAVVYVMFILSDVMVAISAVIGPWMLVLSMLPFCNEWISHWIKSFITFLFYRPLACLLCVVLYIIGLTGMDTGLVELMITCIVFIMAAVKVPSMAENMGGAAAAVGAGMAGMVSKSLKAGAGVGARAAGLGAVAAGARLLSSLKGKATPPKE